MIHVTPRNEGAAVAVAVLDANPILAEAMCRHFAEVRHVGRDGVVSLTWDRADEIGRLKPRIVVLDPAEATSNLSDFVQAARVAVPDLRLVAYASDASEAQARACMELGFRAFVPKSADSAQLTTALAAVANGAIYVDRRFAAALLPAPGGGPAGLSAREEAILRRIGRGLSHKAIAAELDLSHKTVDTYRARGMRKLGLADRGALLAFALKRGWLD